MKTRLVAAITGWLILFACGFLAFSPPLLDAQESAPPPPAAEPTAAAVAEEMDAMEEFIEAREQLGDERTGLDKRIDDIFAPVANGILTVVFVQVPIPGTDMQVPFVLLWLVFASAFLTIYFRFINLRGFTLALKTVTGKFTDDDAPGQVTHFEALTAALSATVGLGNIAGVAVAITLGGPGATFWMIVAGALGMATKFAECTLGVKYRQIDENGVVYGGPMYYLEGGFREKGLGLLGKALAILFAICCVGASFGGGNMFQVNQAYQQFVEVTGGDETWIAENGWAFGVMIGLLVGVVIIGGITSIAKVTSKIVPLMAGVYVLCALAILAVNLPEVPGAFGKILTGAFAPEAVAGGFLGAFIAGIQRAAFSNEAGFGSAPIAHAAVQTKSPASEGVVALLEPFVDTVIVCTMTALVIVVTGTYAGAEQDGVRMTSAAFATVIGWFPYLLSLAVILFAFSTMISWSYYGQQAWTYLVGRGKAKELVFKAIFCLMVVVGSSVTLGNVINFSDGVLFAMCFPNLIAVYLLLPTIKRELKAYQHKISVLEEDMRFKARLQKSREMEEDAR